MTNQSFGAWACKPGRSVTSIKPAWGHELGDIAPLPVLPYGQGRSYGDVCFNSAGNIIDTSGLTKFQSFDKTNGVINVEAGITFDALLRVIVPQGWFVPVTPGTRYLTVGGAIANDVHGKNHHVQGCFGNHVNELTLHRSNGETLICSANQNQNMFAATIGGLGLTGLILSASIKLQKITSSQMDLTTAPFIGFAEFAQLSAQMKDDFQYIVAWLDCTATGDNFCRGLLLGANHSEGDDLTIDLQKKKLNVPFHMPSRTINTYSVKAFNSAYFHLNKRKTSQITKQHMLSYFYPLDSINNWNRIYGSTGFYQMQFVVPLDQAAAMEAILKLIADSGQGSFLSVLKEFGSAESPGMLSFPREGYCLALDFADRGARTVSLLKDIEQLVVSAQGAIYPAKDRLMSTESFRHAYPGYLEFSNFIDEGFTSDFWKRVNK